MGDMTKTMIGVDWASGPDETARILVQGGVIVDCVCEGHAWSAEADPVDDQAKRRVELSGSTCANCDVRAPACGCDQSGRG